MGESQQTRLFDGDGHVIEDEAAIVAHLRSPRHRQLREGQLSAGDLRFNLFPPLGFLTSMPTTRPAWVGRGPRELGRDTDSWQYFLDEVGIEGTVLYPTVGLTIGRMRDLEYAVDLARAYNDWMSETYLRHPSGKFQAAAVLPMQVPAAAAEELRRAVTELGFCAATLPAHGLPNHLGSELYFPVYEMAEELDVGLSCHGGIHDGFGFDDFNVFAAAHALGHPFSLLISLGGMLFNGVFDRFPRLRVAYLEGGSAWILMAAERFSESFGAMPPAEMGQTLQLRDGESVTDRLRELMQTDRLVLGCEGGEQHLEATVEYFGCVPFMYSSDFPHEVSIKSCQHEIEELDELHLTEEQKDMIRFGTASRFYNLKLDGASG